MTIFSVINLPAMVKYFVLVFWAVILFSCKEKKPDLKGEEIVEVEDFIGFFSEIKLPVKITDSGLSKKQTDSQMIGYKVFTQFIPDTVLQKDFGKTAQPQLYALGRTQEKGRETYLFVQAVHAKKRVAYLVCFDKDQNYLNTFPLVKTGVGNYSFAYGQLDKKFQITTYHETRKTTGETWYKRNVYVYNSGANDFTLILTEPNAEMIEDIINPIDTFPKKSKVSGDYVRNKENFISVRDGKDDSEILFFVHFEKDNAECVGELKGTARMISPTKAYYKAVGNPCTIEFTFNGPAVVMKEIEGCGSFRDIKCFFEGRFTKKKEPKAKPVKSKS